MWLANIVPLPTRSEYIGGYMKVPVYLGDAQPEYCTGYVLYTLYLPGCSASTISSCKCCSKLIYLSLDWVLVFDMQVAVLETLVELVHT